MNDIERKLDQIFATQRSLVADVRRIRHTVAALFTFTIRQGENMADKFEQVEERTARIETAVNTVVETTTNEAKDVGAIKTELTKLRETMANGGFVEPERMDSVISRLEQIETNLTGIATTIGDLAPSAPTDENPTPQ